MQRRLPILAALILTLSVQLACSSGGGGKENSKVSEVTTKPAPTQSIELDPVLIQPGKDGKPGRAISADEVFKQANVAYQARRYEESIAHYNTITEYFQDSRFYLPSLFNSGLVYEKLKRWEAAATQYETIINKFSNKVDAKDAFYRLAHVRSELGDWDEIDGLMTRVMLRGDLEHFDRMEAHLRRAMALLELGRYKEARDGFYTMQTLNKQAVGSNRLADSTEFMVQSRFGLGRAYHAMVMEIPLVLPTEKMGQDLQKKAELFLKAQTSYIQALREHHAHWSVASGYMIGRLYEDFYLDILSAEIPKSLSKEQVTLYFDELRKQLRPLMVRAIKVYEKNLSLSKRIATRDNRWVDASDTHLKRLKAYLDDPFTQRRAERLVLKGRPLENLWDPVSMANDVIEEALEEATGAMKKPSKAVPSGAEAPKS